MARHASNWLVLAAPIIVITLFVPARGSADLRCVDPGGPAGRVDVKAHNQRLAAMLSIQGNAYFAAGRLPKGAPPATPKSMKLMPLRKAVKFLDRDPDPLGPSRRRRAVAKLAAYGNHDLKIRRAWQELLHCDKSRIDQVNQTLSTLGDAAANREGQLYDVLDFLFASPTCVPKNATFASADTDDGFSVLIKFEIGDQTTDALAKKVDPQNWAKCSSFIKKSYLTDDSALASPWSCPFSSSYPDAAKKSSSAFGSPYQGSLFEDFVCSSCNSQFKNLLSIQTVQNSHCAAPFNLCATPDAQYQACYGLMDAQSRGCFTNLNVSLTTDGGSISICDPDVNSGLIRVASRKVAKLDSNVANAIMAGLVQISQAEETEMLTEIVCCPSP